LRPEGVLLKSTGHPAAVALEQALNKDGIPLTQLYTEDIAAPEGQRRYGPRRTGRHGSNEVADFDDTCGTFIRLVEG
jgi:hypothetical protein